MVQNKYGQHPQNQQFQQQEVGRQPSQRPPPQ